MDMMEARFRMMAMIGGASEMIGRFSQCRSVKVTPSLVNYIEFQNPFSELPKLMIVSCSSDSPAATTYKYVHSGLFTFDGNGFGCMQAEDEGYTTGRNIVMSCSKDQISFANGGFGTLQNGDIHIHRGNTNTQWETNTEYTIECYI